MSARYGLPPTRTRYFGHGNIIKYCHRPFLTSYDKDCLSRMDCWHNGTWRSKDASKHRISNEAVEMMNDTLINNINAVVEPDDELWHLGDFAMFSKRESVSSYYNRCKGYRDRINCNNVNIIWGNHDENPNLDNDYPIWDLFNSDYTLTQIKAPNNYRTKITLCHYAMAVFNKSHRGAIQLYGHSHSQAEPWMNLNMKGRRSMDVGVDNAFKLLGEYRPFSLDEIMNLVGKRSGFSMDHHVSNLKTDEELLD